MSYLFWLAKYETVIAGGKHSSLFEGKGKLFTMKFFFEEFDLIFFTAESAWPVLKCNQGSDVLENFEVHLLLYDQGNVVKGKFTY